MGLFLWSVALVWLLIAGGIQSQQNTHAVAMSLSAGSRTLAREFLMVANAISLHRYTTGQDTLPSPDTLPGLSFTPDPRIAYQIQGGRLWVWTADIPGLMAELQSQSRHSHLLGYARQQRFVLADGQDTGLSVPSAVPDDAVVYLN